MRKEINGNTRDCWKKRNEERLIDGSRTSSLRSRASGSTYDKHVSYAFSKASQAVEILATGAGDVKDRLLGASGSLWAIHPDMVPPEIREDLTWVRDQLTRFEPYGSEGSVRATLVRIRKGTGVKIAKRIVRIYALFRTYMEQKGNA